jgi:pimeloyl-ACP methyl ester carboxylesterase
VSRPFREKVVTFGEGKGLVGVVTIPTNVRAGAPHVVLINSGILHRVGAHRLYVHFARAFATAGIVTLRFDLSGIGDSERPGGHASSLQDSVAKDIADALAFLCAEYGAEQFVLSGLCSGAFDSFNYALRDPRVIGAALLDMPGPFRNWSYALRHIGVRIFRPKSWRTFAKQLPKQLPLVADAVLNAGPVDGGDSRPVVRGVREAVPYEQFVLDLDALTARKVKLAFIFTGGVSDYYNHQSQFRRRFPRAAKQPTISVEFLHWTNHTFSTRKAREHVIGLLQDWLTTPKAPSSSFHSKLGSSGPPDPSATR